MLEKEVKACLESFAPGRRPLSNIHCTTGQCTGYMMGGARSPEYHYHGTNVEVPRYLQPYHRAIAKQTNPMQASKLAELRDSFARHVSTCTLGEKMRAKVEDEEHFTRLAFKIWTR